MSDDKLRKLEREWSTDASGETAVAYLRELLRSGEVRNLEARLAWRVARLEWTLDDQPSQFVTIAGKFRPEDPLIALSVLRVLFGDVAPALHAPARTGQDSLVVATGPLRCTSGRHFGPIDFDATQPTCERCGQMVAQDQEGPMPVVHISGCNMGLHEGPMRETTGGRVCGSCGVIVAPVQSYLT